ncbi:hypothetical protein K438DRAFT_2024887 [Mycena galopus ATCC 62051]|nr:hypothetical protein K438DRAFT_2024887 [Mycena galopus ATCC 62051]
MRTPLDSNRRQRLEPHPYTAYPNPPPADAGETRAAGGAARPRKGAGLLPVWWLELGERIYMHAESGSEAWRRGGMGGDGDDERGTHEGNIERGMQGGSENEVPALYHGVLLHAP